MERQKGHRSETIPVGDYTLDLSRRQLGDDKAAAALSPISTRFVQILAEANGAVVSRRTLIDLLWDGNHLIGDTALNRLVSETRRGLADLPKADGLIQTVPRKGYRLTVAPIVAGPPASLRENLLRWFGTAFLMILAAALLHWLIDGLTGLIWVLRHP